MNANNEWKWVAAQQYVEILRSGDPHAVATVHMLRLMLTDIGRSLDDLQTDEDEIAECILRGRKISAGVFLQYFERDEVTPEVVEHFFASTLRYGTSSYTEVAEFLRSVAQELGIVLSEFEIVPDIFEQFIRSCYCTLAKCHLNAFHAFDDVSWLHQFQEVVREGEIVLEDDLHITQEIIDHEWHRIHDHWLYAGRQAINALRTEIPGMKSSASGQELWLTMAQHQGDVTLAELGTTEHEVKKLLARFDLYKKLRANARMN